MIDTPLTLTAAFLIGLFSSVHCIGMCGSIMGALSLSLPAEVQKHRLHRFSFVSSYNIGRITSYTLAGLIAGGIGMGIFESSGISQGHEILKGIGAAMMIAIGLYLAGWLPQLAYFERVGKPVWRRLEPIGRRMMPVDSLLKAFVYGMVWGWLPCGLVYTVLIWTLAAGDVLRGAMIMLAFGIGTLPTLIATGVMASWMTRIARSSSTRKAIGVIIILMAFATLFFTIGTDHGHHHH